MLSFSPQIWLEKDQTAVEVHGQSSGLDCVSLANYQATARDCNARYGVICQLKPACTADQWANVENREL